MPDGLRKVLNADANLGKVFIGELVSLENGQIYVNYAGSGSHAVAAKTTLLAWPSPENLEGRRISVLLAFAQNDPETPIVIGFVSDKLPPTEEVTNSGESATHLNIKQRKYLSVSANEEIEISCGMSSITMRADGTIAIKGRRITSRAKELNKIKGSSVCIN